MASGCGDGTGNETDDLRARLKADGFDWGGGQRNVIFVARALRVCRELLAERDRELAAACRERDWWKDVNDAHADAEMAWIRKDEERDASMAALRQQNEALTAALVEIDGQSAPWATKIARDALAASSVLGEEPT